MSTPTRDRRDILNLAARHRLSPALRGGVPILVPPGELTGRCGWEPFFTALHRGGLWVREDSDGSVQVTTRS